MPTFDRPAMTGLSMRKLTNSSELSVQQRRRHPRFSLLYPVRVVFHSGNSSHELDTLSNNISIGGILLESKSPIPQNCELQFFMTVQKSSMSSRILLEGSGRAVRVEQHPSGNGFNVAVRFGRPISQINSFRAFKS